MTIAALHRSVFAGQSESGLRMARYRKRGGLEARLGMARIALVIQRGGGELRLVLIRVTSRTDQLARDIDRVPPGGLMTIGARQLGVLAFQGKSGAAVRFAIKERRLVTGLVMAGRAVRPGGARCELALMWIFVAGRTAVVRHGAVEIVVFVAARAGEFGMLANQRELSSAVVEARAGAIVLPTGGIVTVLAGASEFDVAEGAAMWIHMTALAAAVGESLE